MVLPAPIVRAAKLGFKYTVAAWLDEDSEGGPGGDVNDVDGDRYERTLLIRATYGPCRNEEGSLPFGHFDEGHVELARYLVARGADVNLSDYRNFTPLHYASYGRTEHSLEMVRILLKGGADVFAINVKNHSPVTNALLQLHKAPSGFRIEIVLLLLRALPSLDCAWTGEDADGESYVETVEETMDLTERICDQAGHQPLPPGNCFEVLRNVVAGVRAAGGWRAYDRIPRAEVLVLRSLALRGRAVLPSATRHNGPNMRSLNFLVRCPPEIAWQILGYWRCRYPEEKTCRRKTRIGMQRGGIIDQLGFR